MKEWNIPLAAAAAAAMLALAGQAQAALISRGAGMVYDSTSNVTWLADMNYAKTSGYAAAHLQAGGYNPYTYDVQVLADGRMGLNAAKAFVASLVYGGFDDWRLPTLTPTGNPNVVGGELDNLFVNELGNKFNESVLDTTGDSAQQIANLALFVNVLEGAYWSGSIGQRINGQPDPYSIYTYNTQYGYGGDAGTTDRGPLYVLAVRSGDVGQQDTGNAVPEPGSLLLASLAGLALTATRRRKPLAA